MIKAIFFDFDGVILESVDAKTRAFEEMYLPFGEEIARKVVEHHEKHGGVSRYEKFKVYHQEFLGIKLSEVEIQSMAKHFPEIALQRVLCSSFVNGAKDFLEANDGRLDLWVISGTPTEELRFICQQLGLSTFFQGIFGSPETKTFWGKKIIEERNYAENEILFVGDALTDYSASLDLKTHFLLRKTIVNKPYFINYDGPSSQDLTSLKTIIETL